LLSGERKKSRGEGKKRGREKEGMPGLNLEVAHFTIKCSCGKKNKREEKERKEGEAWSDDRMQCNHFIGEKRIIKGKKRGRKRKGKKKRKRGRIVLFSNLFDN